ncbi:hypothetical protein NXS19_002383 [Fusarium pseudograminearum]|nr:hypothetical protein NXS19_002383 [Fusarium pseudograminearum]
MVVRSGDMARSRSGVLNKQGDAWVSHGMSRWVWLGLAFGAYFHISRFQGMVGHCRSWQAEGWVLVCVSESPSSSPPAALPGYGSEQPSRPMPTNPLYLGRPRSLGGQKHNYPATCNR